jgi:hypothetical protein
VPISLTQSADYRFTNSRRYAKRGDKDNGTTVPYLGTYELDMPMKSVGRREYAYVIVDNYARAVYTRPLRLKWEAADAFKSFRRDNARELSMGGGARGLRAGWY